MSFMIQFGARLTSLGVVIAVLVSSSFSQSSDSLCPASLGAYDTISETCFWHVSSLLQAKDSIKECEKDGGVLAVIPDLATQQFIQTQYNVKLESGTEKYVGYWIGVTDEVTEGVFRTYDGRIQNYTNWKSGDPNDNNMPAQDCARIFPMETPGYLWQDRSCTETAPGLCSRQFHATSNGDTTTIMASRSTIEVVTSEDLSTGWREPIGNQGMTTDQDLGTDQGVTSNPEKTSDPETDSVVQNESTEMTSVATVEMTSSFNRQSSLETTESDSACSVCSTYLKCRFAENILIAADYQKPRTLPSDNPPPLNDAGQPEMTGAGSSEPNTTCYCTCSPYLTLDDPLVKEKINELIETLSISKKNTSANRRKYISVADNRPSARGIGYIGAAILVVSLGSIILLDLSTFLRHVKHLTMKATGREKENTDWATRNPT